MIKKGNAADRANEAEERKAADEASTVNAAREEKHHHHHKKQEGEIVVHELEFSEEVRAMINPQKPGATHKRTHKKSDKKKATEHLKKVEQKTLETMERENKELEDTQFDAVELVWARSELIQTTVAAYLEWLYHQDEEIEFSNFHNCTECFYTYHD